MGNSFILELSKNEFEKLQEISIETGMNYNEIVTFLVKESYESNFKENAKF